MEKNKLLAKLKIRDYNNELEKILENKLFSYDVKNLLLSMLYKIENAYKDYETVKVEVPSKKEYIENILRIIKEKALKIFLVKSETSEAKEFEEKNLKYKVDKQNGEIICIQNELAILTALLKLDQVNIDSGTYNYLERPINAMINQGKLRSDMEVIRDFNGWSWDIVTKEIKDIEYNYLYQTLILINGRKGTKKIKNSELNDIISRIAIEQYICTNKDLEYNKKFEQIKNEKKEKFELLDNKKDFLDKVTQEKKEYTKQIENIDKILNNNDLLKKEYYARNEKLPNREKIFSVSYLVAILDKERMDLLERIEECNRLILPKEFVNQKSRLENEKKFLSSIGEKISREEIIELASKFIEVVGNKISKIKEENKAELINWIYKIRYYRYVPISIEEKVKDIKELDEKFKDLIKQVIKKAQHLKIWDIFAEDENLMYEILKEVFDTKIIYLQNINVQCKYENKVLYVEYYDDTVIESSKKIEIDEVRIKKKFKVFL